MPKLYNPQSCYLGLGSNLNNPIKQLNTAIIHIDNLPHTEFIQSATWYQSKAWGVTDQNDFINTVIEIQTCLTPLALLKAVKTIEYRLMQRQATIKWHARTIDIDILLYGKISLNRKQLIIPHPLIAERSFVVQPLLQLKPNLPINLKKQLSNRLNNRSEFVNLKKIQQKHLH